MAWKDVCNVFSKYKQQAAKQYVYHDPTSEFKKKALIIHLDKKTRLEEHMAEMLTRAVFGLLHYR